LQLILCYLAAAFVCATRAASSETDNLHCMFLGYPQLEYDGVDRTTALTEKTFNKTVLDSDDIAEVVFFHDVELDDDEYDQYECFLQVGGLGMGCEWTVFAGQIPILNQKGFIHIICITVDCTNHERTRL
jgi:hypothetical protein